MFDVIEKLEKANELINEKLDETNSHLFTINENLEKLIELLTPPETMHNDF